LKKDQLNLLDTVDAVELKSLKSKLSISPELRLRADKFGYKNNSIEFDGWKDATNEDNQAGFDKKFETALSARLRLNMTYEIGDTKFIGRLGIHKNSQTDDRICTLNSANGRSSTDEVVFELDKAYVDHTFNKNDEVKIIGSFGVLPTSGGSPSNIAENKSRQSVFPSLTFDMQTYGMILTADLSDYVGMPETFVRAIAAKAYTQNKTQYYYQCNREVIKSGDVYGLFAETKFEGLGDNTFQIGANLISDLSGSPFIGSSTIVDADVPEVLGDVLNASANIEFRNIQYSGVTVFASLGYSNFMPNGNSVNYTWTNPKIGSASRDYAFGEMQDESGYAIFAGIQYKLPDKGSKIGFEYNKGSKYWFSATQGSEDPFNKLATRGSAMELYVVQPISKEIFAKVGYMRMQEDYTGSGWHFGEAYKKDALGTNWYLMLNAQF
jgi:hypothetical protein